MFLTKHWRHPKVVFTFFLAELVLTVPALALFAIADPNLYRTRLWQDGYDNGFNSNPLEVLYAYANHRPIPKVPLVWGQYITSYNVIISVFSTFLLLVKAILFILHLWIPLLSFITHGALTGLWLYSAYGQASPDMSDPKHPQPGAPWYIAKSCDVARYRSNVGYCRQAKAAWAITVIMAIIFLANTLWALWSLIPTEKERLARQARRDGFKDDQEKYDNWQSSPSSFELNELPKTPAVVDEETQVRTRGRFADFKAAMTPRTLALNQLEGRGGVD